MVASQSIKSGVNVNILSGPGGRYELHYDSNPLTGLLFVTDHDEVSGGQLQFKLDGHDLYLNPRRGTFITFDARRLPHSVTPLTCESLRITAPMNFYVEGEDQRPAELDDYLYGDNHEQRQEAESGRIRRETCASDGRISGHRERNRREAGGRRSLGDGDVLPKCG